jgi:hypothetical protein
MQGRIVAAGVSVAVGGALAGFMAAGDHTADASPTSSPSSSSSSSATSGSRDDGVTASPYDRAFDDDDNGFPTTNGGFSQPQPQTRTGGS